MKIDTSMSYKTVAMKLHNFRRKAVLLAAMACLGSGPAWANPTGAQVVNGQVSFATNGGVLSITNSPGSIINWQNFSIQNGEITRFIQQNSSSTVLNRIIGQNPSQILGALQSNGRVFLINPNGILFGAGSKVDVNGLVASTLNISNTDFLTGKLKFNAGDQAGAIKNQGTITTPNGGQVFLIAPNIENSGVITSPNGQVILAAGHSVQLVDSANPDLHIVISSPQDQVVNLGKIIAQSGSIGIYGALINQRGTVSANSAVVGQNGKITFKASGDTLLEAGSVTSATGVGTGGEIHILGKRVGLTDDARVDASGQTGGGTILIGGDYQGLNPDIQNAEQSYVGKDVQIKADALQNGNGGKVIVWADEITRVYGSISAHGGANAGNGGFVETSGHFLDMQGTVDTRAPKGTIGTLLLDPTNIYIAANQASATTAGMSGTDTSVSTGPFTFIASGTVSDSLLTVSIIEFLLANSSVTVSTTNAEGTGTGFIKVVDPITWSSDTPLTLNAAGDIFINAAIHGGNGSALNLNTTGGNITQSSSGIITVVSLSANADAGSVTLNNPNNNVTNINVTQNPPSTPTLSQCAVTPSLPGCSSILPTLAQCSTTPTLAGCSAVLPTLSQCTITPTLAGCQIVLPTTQTAANEPITQAINSTINIINTSASTSTTPTATVIALTTSNKVADAGKDDKTSDAKKEETKKDDKKDIAATEKIGVKNDDAAKKMYCN